MAEEIQTDSASGGTTPEAASDEQNAPQLPARFDRVDCLGFIATTLLAFAGYWFTLSPNMSLSDSGLFSVGAMYAGVPSPPGYPVWTIYSWLFVKLLPFSNIAWRVTIGSAVASAVACGLVALMVSYGSRMTFRGLATFSQLKPRGQNLVRAVCGCVAGLVLGFSGPVWKYAVVVETRSLSLLLFVGVLCFLMRWFFEPGRRRFLCGAFFLFGLLLTNSQELLVALPALIVAILILRPQLGCEMALVVMPIASAATFWNQTAVWIDFPERANWPLLLPMLLVFATGCTLAFAIRRTRAEWKTAVACGAALLLGLAFYLYLPVASMTTPPVNWGYPRTVEGFWHVISRGQFERTHPTNDLCRFMNQIWELLMMSGKQFGWLYLALALVPFCYVGRMPSRGLRWLAGLAAIWLAVTFVTLAELNPPPNRQAWEMMAQYFAASHAILAVWLGLGLMIVGAKIATRNLTNLHRTEASPTHGAAPDQQRSVT